MRVVRAVMPEDADQSLTALLQRATPTEEGCLLHPGSGSYGYAHVWQPGERSVGAHRLALTLWTGQLDGLHAGHACHDAAAAAGACQGGEECLHRRCVNPAHLRRQTPAENLLSSPLTVAAQNAALTHCPSGHPYDDSNTYIRRGRRYCRTCHRAHERARYWARKEMEATR